VGLAIEVGILPDLLANDAEGAEWFEDALAAVNRVLKAERLPAHVEPREPLPGTSRAALDAFPYSTLHHLRRAYAHRVGDPQWMATARPDGGDPADDPEVEALTEQFTSHLLCHSDSEGFYVPIDFADVLTSTEDEDLPGGMLGSSFRLREELVLVAPALGISLVDGTLSDDEARRINALVTADGPLWQEHAAWIALFEAARLSIAHRSAIVFS
jgi:hypothetical protein